MTRYLVTVTVTVEAIPASPTHPVPVPLDQARIAKAGEFQSDHAAGQLALDVTRALTSLIEEQLMGVHEKGIGVPVR